MSLWQRVGFACTDTERRAADDCCLCLEPAVPRPAIRLGMGWLLLFVQLSSERASQAVCQDCSFAQKQGSPLRTWSSSWARVRTGACSPRNAGASAASMWMSGGVAALSDLVRAGALVEQAVAISDARARRGRGRCPDIASLRWHGRCARSRARSRDDLVVSALDAARTGLACSVGSPEPRRVAQAVANLRPYHPKRHNERGTEGSDRLFDGDAADVREGRVDHWKISVVQSPPWRRTSWARAGPPERSWRSR